MRILKKLDLDNVLFLDIETVPLVKSLKEGSPLYDSWEYKVRHNRDNSNFEGSLNDSFIKHAALYAEFSKIVTIVIGKVVDGAIKLKSYTSDNENELLSNFCKDLNGMTAGNKNLILCGHAIIGFDIPFIMRRCLVNQIELPLLIDNAEKKPWELTSIDTLQLWKSTGFTSASLINIATALGITSPKDEMEGGDTYNYYYNIKDGLKLIEKYCKKDVATVANIILRCRYEPILEVKESGDIKQEKVGLVTAVFNAKQTKDVTKLIKKVNSLPEKQLHAGNEILKAITSKIK